MSGRRAVLGGALGLLAALAGSKAGSLAPAAPSHPDAELIALCKAFAEGIKSYDRACDGMEDAGLAAQTVHAIVAGWPAQFDEMERLQARTAEGVQARAYALHVHSGHGGFSFDYPETMTGKLLSMLLRDAAELGSDGAYS